MKKSISLILTLIILISAFSFYAFAESKVELSLTSETVYAGEEFTLNLFISDNSKMSGAVIDINYDKNVLEYVSAEQGAILDRSANISIKNIEGEKSKVRFTYLAPSSSVTSEGVIMSITLKSLPNATGNTEITLTIPNAADFITQDLEKISYEVSNSVVKIINTTYVEQSEEDTSSTTENISQSTEADISQSTTEQESNNNNANSDNDNGDNIIIIVLLVAGLIFITVGVVMLVVSKKKKEQFFFHRILFSGDASEKVHNRKRKTGYIGPLDCERLSNKKSN